MKEQYFEKLLNIKTSGEQKNLMNLYITIGMNLHLMMY